MPPFSYTGKWLISIDERADMRTAAIYKAKTKGKAKDWKISCRVVNRVYLDDDIRQLPNIGNIWKGKLNAIGIFKVATLKALDNTQIHEYCRTTNFKVKEKQLKKYVDIAQSSCNENIPLDMDHRKSKNPYESKYGNNWEKYCDKDALHNKVCVTDLIDHIFSETEKLFPLDDDWFVYHNALSQMTANSAVLYMKEQGWYEHWILPAPDITFADAPDSKKWSAKPCGNQPEVMPMDNLLNKDVHDGVMQNIIMSQMLDDDDSKKFRMNTPKNGLKAYLRIWEHHPSSARIIHDINLTYYSMKCVVKEKGILVSGLVDRPGNRFFAKGGHGGLRLKDTEEKRLEKDNKTFVHPDIKHCLQLLSDVATAKMEIIEDEENIDVE